MSEQSVTHPDHGGIGRRHLLAGGATAAVGAALTLGAGPALGAVGADPRLPAKPFGEAELVLLGTAAGPPPEPNRAGISSALHIEGRNYLIDCGRSSVTNYYNVGLRYADLESIFITHLHADHVADYYNVFLLAGWGVTDDNDALIIQTHRALARLFEQLRDTDRAAEHYRASALAMKIV